jgi:hypothetical protein
VGGRVLVDMDRAVRVDLLTLDVSDGHPDGSVVGRRRRATVRAHAR